MHGLKPKKYRCTNKCISKILWYFIIYRTISACRNWKLSLSTRKEWAGFAKTLQYLFQPSTRGPIGPRVDGWKSYCKVLALPAHEFRVEVRVFNWGLLGELWYIISTTNIWVSVLGYVKNNIIQIFFIWRKYYCLQLFYILLFSLIF
jgi:hypothetical protein